MVEETMATSKKKKRLPSDFEALLDTGDLPALQAVFDTCDVNARGGFEKQTALAFYNCPEQLARWLVAHGADLGAGDARGETPLHARANRRQAKVDVLLELGADVNATDSSQQTPLHAAAFRMNVDAVAKLLARGPVVDARENEGLTPLELALRSCPNNELPQLVEVARWLLGAGAKRTPAMRGFVEKLGTRFEFHRAGYAKEHVAAASAALDELYALFDVAPVERRKMHDGTSPVVVKDGPWQQQHDELWNLLVPSSGPAATVQGEVIRISGRLDREINGNGGANWNEQFREMARAFLVHVGSGSPLSPPELAVAGAIVAELVARATGDLDRMGQLAVTWVLRNSNPLPLVRTTSYHH
jgi:hypothetical protein